jgi:hypothetical protein
MSDPDPLRLALACTRAALAQLAQVEAALVQALQRPVEGGLEGSLQPPFATTTHRRDHRPGRPAKLSIDIELRTFVEARLGFLTFDQIAAAVAAHFPPDRRVGKSAIHEWWHTHRKRITEGKVLGWPGT